MFRQEVPIEKTHASGTWRAIRSMAVPANVTTAHSSQSAIHESGTRQMKNIEEEVIPFKRRNSPGYPETADTSLSKS